jgi:putative endonuclease
LLSRIIFAFVNRAARRGLASGQAAEPSQRHARRTGLRGETFAYWYLRQRGYVIVGRNFKLPGVKGEIDLVGFDGDVLAFVEVKTRTSASTGGPSTLPEDAVTSDKRHALRRIAAGFLQHRRLAAAESRFDVLAIESRPGRAPEVRLHKGAFGWEG